MKKLKKLKGILTSQTAALVYFALMFVGAILLINYFDPPYAQVASTPAVPVQLPPQILQLQAQVKFLQDNILQLQQKQALQDTTLAYLVIYNVEFGEDYPWIPKRIGKQVGPRFQAKYDSIVADILKQKLIKIDIDYE